MKRLRLEHSSMKKFSMVGIFIAALALGVSFGVGDTVAAAAYETDNIIDYQDNERSANKRLDYVCRDGALAGHAGWLGSGTVSPNRATGEFKMDLKIKFKRCPGGSEAPRKYAVIGYPPGETATIEGLSFCDNIGTFGNHTYRGQIRRGESPGSRTERYVGDYTYDCVKFMAGAENHLVRFNSNRYGRQPGFYMYDEIDYKNYGTVTRTISGKIKDWKQKSEVSGSMAVTLPANLCSYYMTGPEDRPNFISDLYCQKVKFNIEWTGNYELTPNVSVDGSLIEGEPFDVDEVKSTVQNSNNGSKSESHDAAISRFVVRKENYSSVVKQNLTKSGLSSYLFSKLYTIDRYVNNQFKGQDVTLLNGLGSVSGLNPGQTKVIYNNSDSIAFNLKIGDRLCYMTSIQRPKYSDSTSVWRHSAPACLTVGVRPHMQVRSGDIMVDGKIIAGATNRQGRTYGSWGEYAAIAGGKINAGGAGFGSGAIYRMGAAGAAPNKGFLSFSNNYGTNHGNFGEPIGSNFSALADYLAKLTPTSSAHNRSNVSSIDLDTLTTPGRYIISRPSGEIKVRGDLRKGVSVIVLAKHNQTVTIDGNITTPDTYDSVRELSQLAIVASAGSEQKVNINPGVTRADAWIIVPGGTINTCRESGAPKRAGGCANTLFVNGPVIAKDFLLRRTGGEDKVSSGAAKQSMPAEVFNLRPDAYLWMTNQVNNSGARYVTTQSIELPPQY